MISHIQFENLFFQIYFLFIAILFNACSPAPVQPTISPSETPVIPTTTPIPSPTNTVIPTNSATPFMVPSLDPKLVGVGAHGAMVCINSDVLNQLEGIILTANISQEDKALDYAVKGQQIDKKGICFEMIDSKYKNKIPVDVQINATEQTNLPIQNERQTYRIGNYQIFPSLLYIYKDLELSKTNFALPQPQSHGGAYDLAPVSSNKYPNGLGAPVFSPCNATVYRSEILDGRTHRIILFCEDSGYYINMGHFENSTIKEGMHVAANDLLGNLLNEEGIGYPHVHFQLISPNNIPINRHCQGDIFKDCGKPLELMVPQKILDIQGLPTGMWLSDTLPPSTLKWISSQSFNPKY